MKKLLALLLALAMVLSMAACGAKTEGKSNADDIPDEMTSADGKYQVKLTLGDTVSVELIPVN